MNNSSSLFLASLRNVLQGNLEVAQELYNKAQDSSQYGDLGYSESTHPDLPYLEEALGTLLGSFDFARCMRPDGSFYGTRGQCKKGTEAAPADRRGTGKRGKQLVKARAAGKRMSEMTTEERRAHLDRKKKEMVSKLKKDPDLHKIWVKEVNDGISPGFSRTSGWEKYPSVSAMAKAVASERLKKDYNLLNRRAIQENGPSGPRSVAQAQKLIKFGRETGNRRAAQVGLEMLRDANQKALKEIRSLQDRGVKLQKAEDTLTQVEKNLRDMPEDRKVRSQLARVQQAIEEVREMKKANLRSQAEAEKASKIGMIGEATPAQRAAAENKATQMRNRNAQADRAALARKVAKELGEDVRSVKVAKEVERRQKETTRNNPKTVRANVDELKNQILKAKQALQSAKESKSPKDIRKAQAEFDSLKDKLTSSLEEAKKTGTILW